MKKIESIARELYECLGLIYLDCEQLSHKTKEFHSYLEDCPVVKRIRGAIKEYEEYMTE